MAFHWLSALIIICLLIMGLIMVEMPKPDKYVFYGLHKSFGMILLILVAARLLWRLFHKPPPLKAQTPRFQKIVSILTHWALYGLMFWMPLAGWVMSSAGGHPVAIFGLAIAPIVAPNADLGRFANQMHELGAWVLIGLITLHIAAAFYHQFIQKDGLMWRMIPKR